MDVTVAFLNGDLHAEVYMEQGKGFVNDETLVYKLKRSIYGFKKSPTYWNEMLD